MVLVLLHGNNRGGKTACEEEDKKQQKKKGSNGESSAQNVQSCAATCFDTHEDNHGALNVFKKHEDDHGASNIFDTHEPDHEDDHGAPIGTTPLGTASIFDNLSPLIPLSQIWALEDFHIHRKKKVQKIQQLKLREKKLSNSQDC
ncbi:uncharacterized protein LOC125369439 [Ricinus communis]|uniref:uncharacterized protein LOC125369439 n=1 Tax=Ricinus communis TaxID=3988 RepID=UPI00201A8E58|nr:uncharacterized protein LOC125369439 [Ricinus communis]